MSVHKGTSYKENLTKLFVMGFRTLEGDICLTEMVVPLLILEVLVIILNGVLALPGDTTQLYWVNRCEVSASSRISSAVNLMI